MAAVGVIIDQAANNTAMRETNQTVADKIIEIMSARDVVNTGTIAA